MSRLDGFLHRLRAVVRGADYDRELAEEREFHLSLEQMHQQAAGLDAATARAQARRKYGNITTHTEAQRKVHRFYRWEQVRDDVRVTLRQLRRAPALTLGIVGTFALGNGANASMFDLLDRTLFRAPPMLANVNATHRIVFTGGDNFAPNTGADYRTAQDLQQWTNSFSSFGAYWSSSGMAAGAGMETREVPVAGFGASLWPMFAMRPALGRFYGPTEDQPPSGAQVVVLDYAYWQSQFGGRADVLGRSLPVGEKIYEIIGVTPKGFRGFGRAAAPAVYVPIASVASHVMGGDEPLAWVNEYGGSWLSLIAIRKANISVDAATSDLTQAYARSRAQSLIANNRTASASEAPLRAIAAHILPERGPMRSRVGSIVVWLAGVALVVLGIACANVVNLLIAHAERRTHEFAVRSAIGISRWRLAQQLLTESVVLSVLGALVGLVVAALTGSVLRQTVLGFTTHVATSALEMRTVAATAVLTIIAGLVAGLYPAWVALRRPIATGLKAGPRTGTRASAPLRATLLAAQAALSVVLLIGSMLFVRSMRNLQQLPMGFDVDRLLYVNPQARTVEVSDPDREALLARLAERARQVPGVVNVARATSIPFWNSRTPRVFLPSGDTLPRSGRFVMQQASPDYFATTGTTLRRGRGIDRTDQTGSTPVMIVSDSMAARIWPRRDPIGECLRVGEATASCRQVVGVAAAIRRDDLTNDDGLQYYIPTSQGNPGMGGLLVRFADGAAAHSEAMREALQPLIPGDGYVAPLALTDIIDPLRQSWRLGATVFTWFAVLALLLACGGIYSVIAYDVSRRSHELSIRLALGARQRGIVSLVLMGSLRVMAVGIAVGLVLAVFIGPFVEPQLFGITARDPFSMAAATLALGVAASLAAIFPASRASRVDPAHALREA